MKQKTNRLHFSTRTVAMILSVIMLIGSIATGSMLSTFAAYLQDAAQSDAVTQAASEGSDIAKSAIPSDGAAAQADNEVKPDLSGFAENEIVRDMKNDFAAVSANVDLAASGSPNYISYGYKAAGDSTTLSSNKVSGASITFTSEHSDDYYFVSATDDGNYRSSVYSSAYPGYSYSGFTNNAGGNGNNKHNYNDGKINWVESYNTAVSGIKLQVVSGTTVTVTYKNNTGVYEVTATSGSGSGGGGGDDPVTPGEAVSDNDLIAVLKREKVYIYHGDKWGSGTKYVMEGKTTTQAASGTSEKLTIDNSDCHVAHSAIPVNANYSISHNIDWSGMSINDGSNITTAQAGYLYYIYSKSYGNNTLVTKSSQPTVTWSTSSATIKPGAASSSIKATVSGNTGANRSSTVKYFYTADGTTFYTFDPANTSSFAPGTYTIYAAAYDTKIYVAAATTGTLTVLPKLASKLDIEADPDTLTAEGQSSTITVTASDLVSGQNNLTYTLYKKGTSSDTKVEEKRVTDGANTTTFTVTPNARSTDYYATVAPTAGTTSYDAVQSGTVTISNTDEQYVPTYTVNFSSSNTTYGTVTAKSTYKGTTTTLTSGDSVKEGASVTFTATEKTGGTFVEWDNFDSTATTVTRVIRAATTVQGVFGQKGYKLLIKNGTTVDMKELPNGTYISPSAYANSTVFQIARNANSTKSLSSEATQGVAPDGTKYKVTSWTSGTTQGGNSFTTYGNQSGSLYIVYDPATDQVWLTSEPDDLYGVTVIAKDGTIRYGYSTADKYTSAFGNTTLTITDGEGTNIPSHEAFGGLAEAVDLTAAQVRKGITLKVVTQVDAAHVASGYYVKGFVVSGYEESFSVLMQDFDGNTDVTPIDVMNRINSGYNEFELTLDTYPAKNIEITPVYAVKEANAGDNIRFYVDGFAGDVYKSWDGVIAVDAYNTSGDPILGEYPGQPMINYNGRYMVDLPRSGVTGITLNNYVWDRVHSNLFYGTDGVDAPTTGNGYLQKIQAANKQTYDFNDFVYLKQVMDADGEDEDIIFSFRHKYDENHNTVENSNLGKSTYYVDTTGGSSESTAFDYRNGFKTINPNDSIYQWENLTDFYDNRVDIFGDKIDIKDTEGESTNPKAAYDNPIRIVSNGYDFSKAGKYATAWAVYAPVDTSGKAAYKGAYDHYELVDVFGGQGNVVNGVGTFDSSAYLVNPEHSDNLRDKYDEAYYNDGQHTRVANFVYDMAKIPTVISYEYAIYCNKSNLNLEQAGSGATDGNPGLRSDGRWFTTTSDQFLTAHTVVEYAEKDDDSLYHRDYFQSGGIDYTSGSEYVKTVNTGLSTGIKAYFENDDSDDGEDSKTGVAYQNTPGDTEAYAVSDGEHTFNLKTVGDTNGDYVFKGWYLYSNGKYSFITRDTSYKSEATANDVYVARYYKVPSGNLNLTHLIDSASTGTGHTYIKAEIRNPNNTQTLYTYPEVENGPIVVSPTYIKQDSSNQLLITLRTTPDSFSEFEQFLEYINTTVGRTITDENGGLVNNYAYVDINTTSTEVTATIRFLISYLFDTDGNQRIKSMPFTSKLKLPDYKYSIRYQYPAYNPTFGNQAYTVEGKFTQEELEEYMTINNQHMLSFVENDTLLQNFISNHAPYEDNFQQTLSFTTSGIESQSYNKSNYTYTILIHSQNNAVQYVYPTFNFPYAVDNKYVAQESGSSGKIKMDEVNSITLSGRRIFEWVTTSGETSQADLDAHPENKPVFIKAPLIIYTDVSDENTARYFKYWSVETTANYTNMKMASREFTRCYDPEFNLSLFQDCTITPVYDVDTFESRGMVAPVPTDNSEYGYSRFDPEIQQKLDSDNGVTITFIENSRNQYNKGDFGDAQGAAAAMADSREGAGDRVYSDFVLSYNNVAGGKLIKDLGDGKMCGLFIETVDDLRQEDGKYVVDNEAYYKNLYGSTLSGDHFGLTKDQIEAYIKGGTRPNGCDKSEFAATELDNKNRMQYYYSLTNRNHISGSASNKTMPEGEYNKNNYKVFRAYAYIREADNSKITISEVPVYFTINEIGSIALGAPANN